MNIIKNKNTSQRLNCEGLLLKVIYQIQLSALMIT